MKNQISQFFSKYFKIRQWKLIKKNAYFYTKSFDFIDDDIFSNKNVKNFFNISILKFSYESIIEFRAKPDCFLYRMKFYLTEMKYYIQKDVSFTLIDSLREYLKTYIKKFSFLFTNSFLKNFFNEIINLCSNKKTYNELIPLIEDCIKIYKNTKIEEKFKDKLVQMLKSEVEENIIDLYYVSSEFFSIYLHKDIDISYIRSKLNWIITNKINNNVVDEIISIFLNYEETQNENSYFYMKYDKYDPKNHLEQNTKNDELKEIIKTITWLEITEKYKKTILEDMKYKNEDQFLEIFIQNAKTINDIYNKSLEVIDDLALENWFYDKKIWISKNNDAFVWTQNKIVKLSYKTLTKLFTYKKFNYKINEYSFKKDNELNKILLSIYKDLSSDYEMINNNNSKFLSNWTYLERIANILGNKNTTPDNLYELCVLFMITSPQIIADKIRFAYNKIYDSKYTHYDFWIRKDITLKSDFYEKLKKIYLNEMFNNENTKNWKEFYKFELLKAYKIRNRVVHSITKIEQTEICNIYEMVIRSIESVLILQNSSFIKNNGIEFELSSKNIFHWINFINEFNKDKEFPFDIINKPKELN